MASQSQPHFVLIPFMAQGHIIPMVDIAKLLASRNVIVTLVATHLTADRISTSIARAAESGLSIRILKLRFPATEAGLPEGCETLDAVSCSSKIPRFFAATSMLREPLEKLLEEAKPRLTCIISDILLPWTADIASKLRVPMVSFDGMNCFTLLCNELLYSSKVYETGSETDPFVVPGLPDRIELTRVQLPGMLYPNPKLNMFKVRDSIRKAEAGTCGVLVNSFEELESEYIKGYRQKTGNKLWCFGPVSLVNSSALDIAERGNKPAMNEQELLKWLDNRETGSVIYVCLGSLTRLKPDELVEMGSALEASNRPFIWVIRGGNREEQAEQWIQENGFEERVKGRGMLVRGWAPQALILSHPSVGMFITHCGWNSTIEAICAGVPMATWPLSGEQFYNEKLVVQVLEVGVAVGAERIVFFGQEDEYSAVVDREKIGVAIGRIMGGGEGGLRKERARRLAKMAKEAVAQGGSSYLSIGLFIEDIKMEATNMLQSK